MRFFSDAQRQEKTGKKHLPKKQPPARIFTRFFSDAQRQEKTGKKRAPDTPCASDRHAAPIQISKACTGTAQPPPRENTPPFFKHAPRLKNLKVKNTAHHAVS